MNILQHDILPSITPFRANDGKKNEPTAENGKAERSERESSQSRGISGRVPARTLCFATALLFYGIRRRR